MENFQGGPQSPWGYRPSGSSGGQAPKRNEGWSSSSLYQPNPHLVSVAKPIPVASRGTSPAGVPYRTTTGGPVSLSPTLEMYGSVGCLGAPVGRRLSMVRSPINGGQVMTPTPRSVSVQYPSAFEAQTPAPTPGPPTSFSGRLPHHFVDPNFGSQPMIPITKAMMMSPHPYSPPIAAVHRFDQPSPVISPVPFSPIAMQEDPRYWGNCGPPGLDYRVSSHALNQQTTATIIANQSQDYIDEKLAEFQEQIYKLQDEQERVQKKTFINWMNSYLSKRNPPLRVADLLEDLRDGTKLLHLLEVLSGEKLPVEKGRILRRPHFLSNCNTALEFLRSKQIKLVNINATDVVDGRPSVVLGLIWTIILYFQIEENTRVLESLGTAQASSQVYGGSSSMGIWPGSGVASPAQPGKLGLVRDQQSNKWKLGAKDALLAWTRSRITSKFGIRIDDFGKSWRDGRAFLGLVNGIRSGRPDHNSVGSIMSSGSNRDRLEAAFGAAERDLGIARLLDPEDVDVDNPDERSVMTYVAQFLHRYADGFSERREGAISGAEENLEAEFKAMETWLSDRIKWFEEAHLSKGQALKDYAKYQDFKANIEKKQSDYDALRSVIKDSFEPWSSEARESALTSIETKWQKVAAQVRHWQWLLDTALPGELGQVGEWLNQGEALVYSEDIPTEFNEEAAAVLSQKIDDHKAFFQDWPSVKEQAFRLTGPGSSFINKTMTPCPPEDQIRSLLVRLENIGPKGEIRAVRLKYLEHKCCIVAFLQLTEAKLKNWTVKYGNEVRVQQVLNQYRTFVSKNKIFQEFNKAFVEFQQVCQEYEALGDIGEAEKEEVKVFILDIRKRWETTSTDLRYIQSLLEEVASHWKRWSSTSGRIRDYLEESLRRLGQLSRQQGDDPDGDSGVGVSGGHVAEEHFRDIGEWKNRYMELQDTVNFLVATCDENTANDLRLKFQELAQRWEDLMRHIDAFVASNELTMARLDFNRSLEELSSWIRRSEAVLSTHQTLELDCVEEAVGTLTSMQSEVGRIEDVFRGLSGMLQHLVSREIGQVEVDDLMATLRREKEKLVIIRTIIPTKLHLYHNLLAQLASAAENRAEVTNWCNLISDMSSAHRLVGSRDHFKDEQLRLRAITVALPRVQAQRQAAKKLADTIFTNLKSNEAIDTGPLHEATKDMEVRCEETLKRLQGLEEDVADAIKSWDDFEASRNKLEMRLVQLRANGGADGLEDQDNETASDETDGPLDNSPPLSGIDSIDKRLMVQHQDLVKALTKRLDTGSSKEVADNLLRIVSELKDLRRSQEAAKTRANFQAEEKVVGRCLGSLETLLAAQSQKVMIESKEDLISHRATIEEGLGCLRLLVSKHFCGEKSESDDPMKKSLEKLEERWNKARVKLDTMAARQKETLVLDAQFRDRQAKVKMWLETAESSLASVGDCSSTANQKTLLEDLLEAGEAHKVDVKWLLETSSYLKEALWSVKEDTNEGGRVKEDLNLIVERFRACQQRVKTSLKEVETKVSLLELEKEIDQLNAGLDKLSLTTDPKEIPEDEALVGIEGLNNAWNGQIQRYQGRKAAIESTLERGRDILNRAIASGPEQMNINTEVALQSLEKRWADVTSNVRKVEKVQMEVNRLWNANLALQAAVSGDTERLVRQLALSEGGDKSSESRLATLADLKQRVILSQESIHANCSAISAVVTAVRSMPSARGKCGVSGAQLSQDQQDWVNKTLSSCEEEVQRLTIACQLEVHKISKADADLTECWDIIKSLVHRLLGGPSVAGADCDSLEHQMTALKERVTTLDPNSTSYAEATSLPSADQELKELLESTKDLEVVMGMRLKLDGGLRRCDPSSKSEEPATSISSLDQVKAHLQIKEAGLKDLVKLGSCLRDMETKVSHIISTLSARNGRHGPTGQGQELQEPLARAELRGRWEVCRVDLERSVREMRKLVGVWQAFDDLAHDLMAWLDAKEGLLDKVASQCGFAPSSLPDVFKPLSRDLLAVSNEAAKRQTEVKEMGILLARLQELAAGSQLILGTPTEGPSQMAADVEERTRRLEDRAKDCAEKLSIAVSLSKELKQKVSLLKEWLIRKRQKLHCSSNSEQPLMDVPETSMDEFLWMSKAARAEVGDKLKFIDSVLGVEESLGEMSGLKEECLDFGDTLEANIAFVDKLLNLQKWSQQCRRNLHQEMPRPEVVKMISRQLAELQQDEDRSPSKTGHPRSVKVVRLHHGSATATEVLEQTYLAEVEENLARAIKEAELWERFRMAEQKLAGGMKEILQEIQRITVTDSSLEALKAAAQSVGKLAESCEELRKVKEEFNDLGRTLVTSMASNTGSQELTPAVAAEEDGDHGVGRREMAKVGAPPAKSSSASSMENSIREAVAAANSKWERISNILLEQNTKSRFLISLWSSCHEIRNRLEEDMKLPEATLNDLNDESDPSSAEKEKLLNRLETCRKAVEALKKIRHPFEALFKKQSQLMQELLTVPGFDVGPLKTELRDVQRRFTVLGTSLASKLSLFESQMEARRSLDLFLDQVEAASSEVEQELSSMRGSSSQVLGASGSAPVAYFLDCDREIFRLKLGKIEATLASSQIKLAAAEGKADYLSGLLKLEAPLSDDRLMTVSLRLRGQKAECEALKIHIRDLDAEWEAIKEDIRKQSSQLETLMAEDAKGQEQEASSVGRMRQRLINTKASMQTLLAIEVNLDKLVAGTDNGLWTQLGGESRFRHCGDFVKTVHCLADLRKRCEAMLAQRQLTAKETKARLEVKLHEEGLKKAQIGLSVVKGLAQRPEVTVDELRKALDEFASSILSRRKEAVEILSDINDDRESVSVTDQPFLQEAEALVEVRVKEVEEIARLTREFITLEGALIMQVEKDPIDIESLRTDLANLEAVAKRLGNPVSLDSCQKLFATVDKLEAKAKVNREAKAMVSGLEELADNLKSQLDRLKAWVDMKTEALSSVDLSLSGKSFLVNLQQEVNERLAELQQIRCRAEVKFKETSQKRVGMGRDDDLLNGATRRVSSMFEALLDLIKRYENFQKVLLELEVEWSTISDAMAKLEAWMTLADKDEANDSLQEGLRSALEASKAVSDHKAMAQNLRAKVMSKEASSGTAVRVNSFLDQLEGMEVLAVGKVKLFKRAVDAEEELCKKALIIQQAINELQEKLDRLHDCVHGDRDQGRCCCGDMAAFAEEQDRNVTQLLKQVAEERDRLEPLLSELQTSPAVISELETLTLNWEQLVIKAAQGVADYEEMTRRLAELDAILTEMDVAAKKLLDGKEAAFLIVEAAEDDEAGPLSLESKLSRLNQVKDLAAEVAVKLMDVDLVSKAPEFANFFEGHESKVHHKMDVLKTRLGGARDKLADRSRALESAVEDHRRAQKDMEAMLGWVREATQRLDNLSVLQDADATSSTLRERKEELDQLEVEIQSKAKGVGDMLGGRWLGEPAATLRTEWGQLRDSLREKSGIVEELLRELQELARLQEKLTRWLREIEFAMQEHTKLRPTLEEKKCQLESHLMIHKEIQSGSKGGDQSSLLHQVCSKAERILWLLRSQRRVSGDQPDGSSAKEQDLNDGDDEDEEDEDEEEEGGLQEYVESIRSLFKSIEAKSGNLLDKLSMCVAEHTEYSRMLDKFKDFFAAQTEMVSNCVQEDLRGEKEDLVHKAEMMAQLKANLTMGQAKIEALDKQACVVKHSTSVPGVEQLEAEYKETLAAWRTHCTLVEDLDLNVEKMLRRWTQHLSDLDRINQWLEDRASMDLGASGVLRDLDEDVLLQCVKQRKSVREACSKFQEDYLNEFLTAGHSLHELSGSSQVWRSLQKVQEAFSARMEMAEDRLQAAQDLLAAFIKFDRSKVEAETALNQMEIRLDAAEEAAENLSSFPESDDDAGIDKNLEELGRDLHFMKSLMSKEGFSIDETFASILKAFRARWVSLQTRSSELKEFRCELVKIRKYTVKLASFQDDVARLSAVSWPGLHPPELPVPEEGQSAADYVASLGPILEKLVVSMVDREASVKSSLRELKQQVGDWHSLWSQEEIKRHRGEASTASIGQSFSELVTWIDQKLKESEEGTAKAQMLGVQVNRLDVLAKAFAGWAGAVSSSTRALKEQFWPIGLDDLNLLMPKADNLVAEASGTSCAEDLNGLSDMCSALSALYPAAFQSAMNLISLERRVLSETAMDAKQAIEQAIATHTQNQKLYDEALAWLRSQEDILSRFSFGSDLDEKLNQHESLKIVLRTLQIWMESFLPNYLNSVAELDQFYAGLVEEAEYGEPGSMAGNEHLRPQVPWTIKKKQICRKSELLEDKLKEVLVQSLASIDIHKEFEGKYVECQSGLEQLASQSHLEDSSGLKMEVEFLLRDLIILSKRLSTQTSNSGNVLIKQKMAILQSEKAELSKLSDDAEVGGPASTERLGENEVPSSSSSSSECISEDAFFDFSDWLQEKETILMFTEVQPGTSLEDKERLLRALKREVADVASSPEALKALEMCGLADGAPKIVRYENLLREARTLIKKHEATVASQRRLLEDLARLQQGLQDLEDRAADETGDDASKSASDLHGILQTRLKRLLSHVAEASMLKTQLLGVKTSQKDAVVLYASEQENEAIVSSMEDTQVRLERVESILTQSSKRTEDRLAGLDCLVAKEADLMACLRSLADDLSLATSGSSNSFEEKCQTLEKLRRLRAKLLAVGDIEMAELENALADLDLAPSGTKDEFARLMDRCEFSMAQIEEEQLALQGLEEQIKDMEAFIMEKNQELQTSIYGGDKDCCPGSVGNILAKTDAIDKMGLEAKESGASKLRQLFLALDGASRNLCGPSRAALKAQVDRCQKGWHKFMSGLREAKLALDTEANDWKAITDQVDILLGQLDSLEFRLVKPDAAMTDLKSSDRLAEIRADLERLRQSQHKLQCLKMDIESLDRNLVQRSKSPSVRLYHPDWSRLLQRFKQLEDDIAESLALKENLLQNYRAFKSRQSELEVFIQRCRYKMEAAEQRSPNDKNFANAIVQTLANLLNKEAQGQIMVEQLSQTAELLSLASPEHEAEVSASTGNLVTEFRQLLDQVHRQNDQLETVMKCYREFREETDRLSDWIKQIGINIKAIKTALPSSLSDKEKASRDMEELCGRIEEVGRSQVAGSFVALAARMEGSPLAVNSSAQRQDIEQRFLATAATAQQVRQMVAEAFNHHSQFSQMAEKAKEWMEAAWTNVRECTAAAATATTAGSTSRTTGKEDLQFQLQRIQEQIDSQGEGLALIQGAMEWADRAMRNTRSDGKDSIQQTLKGLNTEWDKLTRKMANARVSVESDLLSCSDQDQAGENQIEAVNMKLEEWIRDREVRLRRATTNTATSQDKDQGVRRGTISSACVTERNRSLCQANLVLQDIQAFEPLVKQTLQLGGAGASVLGRPSSSVEHESISISTTRPTSTTLAQKYQDLSRHAQEVIDHEKEMVRRHQLFMETGNEYMLWLRLARDKLDKCLEKGSPGVPVPGDGAANPDKEMTKLAELKILESEVAREGQPKLEAALRSATSACEMALADDKDIVEEESAFMQEEHDKVLEEIRATLQLVEKSVVLSKDCKEVKDSCQKFLERTKSLVETAASRLEPSEQLKKAALEKLQVELQKVLDWQKKLDHFSHKNAQQQQQLARLRKQQLRASSSCSRESSTSLTSTTTLQAPPSLKMASSSDLTLLSKNFDSLSAAVKSAIKKLELQYQEHHQHSTLVGECARLLCEEIEPRLCSLNEMGSVARTRSMEAFEGELAEVITLQRLVEEAQHKVTYLAELQQRVVAHTEESGVSKVVQPVRDLKDRLDTVTKEFQGVRDRVTRAVHRLRDLANRCEVIHHWIEGIAHGLELGGRPLDSLQDARVQLESLKSYQSEIDDWSPLIRKLQDGDLEEHQSLDKVDEVVANCARIKAQLDEEAEIFLEAFQRLIDFEECDIYSKDIFQIRQRAEESLRCILTEGALKRELDLVQDSKGTSASVDQSRLLQGAEVDEGQGDSVSGFDILDSSENQVAQPEDGNLDEESASEEPPLLEAGDQGHLLLLHSQVENEMKRFQTWMMRSRKDFYALVNQIKRPPGLAEALSRLKTIVSESKEIESGFRETCRKLTSSTAAASALILAKIAKLESEFSQLESDIVDTLAAGQELLQRCQELQRKVEEGRDRLKDCQEALDLGGDSCSAETLKALLENLEESVADLSSSLAQLLASSDMLESHPFVGEVVDYVNSEVKTFIAKCEVMPNQMQAKVRDQKKTKVADAFEKSKELQALAQKALGGETSVHGLSGLVSKLRRHLDLLGSFGASLQDDEEEIKVLEDEAKLFESLLAKLTEMEKKHPLEKVEDPVVLVGSQLDTWRPQPLMASSLEAEIECGLQSEIHRLEVLEGKMAAIAASESMSLSAKEVALRELLVSDIPDLNGAVTNLSRQKDLIPSEQQGIGAELEDLPDQVRMKENRIQSWLNQLKVKAGALEDISVDLGAFETALQEKRHQVLLENDGDDEDYDEEALKMHLSDMDSLGLTIESLKAKIKAQKNGGEVLRVCWDLDSLATRLEAVEKAHADLAERVREALCAAQESQRQQRQMDEICETASVWLASKSQEALPCVECHPLRSSGISEQILQLQRTYSDIKEFEEDTLLRAKKCAQLSIHEDLDDLKKSFSDLRAIVLKNIGKLSEEFESRKAFEAKLAGCEDWISKAEGVISCDVITSNAKDDAVRDHLNRFRGLLGQLEHEIRPVLENDIAAEADSFLNFLSPADKASLTGALAFHRANLDRLSTDVHNKLEELSGRAAALESSQSSLDQWKQTLEGSRRQLDSIQLRSQRGLEDTGLAGTLGLLEELEHRLQLLKDRQYEAGDGPSATATAITAGPDALAAGVMGQQLHDLLASVKLEIDRTKELTLLELQFRQAVSALRLSLEMCLEELSEDPKRIPEPGGIRACERDLAMALEWSEKLASSCRVSLEEKNAMAEVLRSLKSDLLKLKNHLVKSDDHEVQERLLDLELSLKKRPVWPLAPNQEDVAREKSILDESALKLAGLADRVSEPGQQREISDLRKELDVKRQFLEAQLRERGNLEAALQSLCANLDKAESLVELPVDHQDIGGQLSSLEPLMTDFLFESIKAARDTRLKISASTTEAEDQDPLLEIESRARRVRERAKAKYKVLKEQMDHWTVCQDLVPILTGVLGSLASAGPVVTATSSSSSGLQAALDQCTSDLNMLARAKLDAERLSRASEAVEAEAGDNEATKTFLADSLRPALARFQDDSARLALKRDCLANMLRAVSETEAAFKDLNNRYVDLQDSFASVCRPLRQIEDEADYSKAAAKLQELKAEADGAIMGCEQALSRLQDHHRDLASNDLGQLLQLDSLTSARDQLRQPLLEFGTALEAEAAKVRAKKECVDQFKAGLLFLRTRLASLDRDFQAIDIEQEQHSSTTTTTSSDNTLFVVRMGVDAGQEELAALKSKFKAEMCSMEPSFKASPKLTTKSNKGLPSRPHTLISEALEIEKGFADLEDRLHQTEVAVGQRVKAQAEFSAALDEIRQWLDWAEMARAVAEQTGGMDDAALASLCIESGANQSRVDASLIRQADRGQGLSHRVRDLEELAERQRQINWWIDDKGKQTRFDVIEATEDHDSRILPVEEEPAEGWLAAVCGLGLRLALQVLAALALLLLFGWLFDDDCSRRRGNTVRESLEPLLQWSDGPPPM